MIVTIDFETYYTAEYSLRRMSETDYIQSPLFECIMCAVKVGDGLSEIHVGRDQVAARFARIGREIGWENVALLSHNMRFDGAIAAWHFHVRPKLYLCTLSMARALTHIAAGGSSLDKVSEYLGLPPKGTFLATAIGKHLSDFGADLADYVAYCLRDNDNCYEIFQRFTRVFPTSELGVVDLTLRMFVEPQVKLNAAALFNHLLDVRAARAVAFDRVAHIDKSVFSSNQKFSALLTSMGVDVPMKTSVTTGEEIPALAKNDRAFKELCDDDTLPTEVQAVLAARIGAKSTGEETRTETLLNLSTRAWGNDQGWCPMPLKYYGAHCVPGDTEVLTPMGWLALEHWQGGDIAQVQSDQTIEFLPATRFVGPVVDDWVDVSAPYMQCAFTLGHTLPYLQHGTMRWATMQAAALSARGSVHVPLAGHLIGEGSIIPEMMRVLAMVQADGHWELDPAQGRGLSVFVKKPRKIERARSLLAAMAIKFREGVFPSHPGFVRFSIAWDDVPGWLTPERKFFGPWLLDSTSEAREALMNEVVHWDGWMQGGMIYYSTSDRINADWLATLAHLTERCASIDPHRGRGGNQRVNYRVALRQRPSGMVFKKHVATIWKPQRSYCATTSTGFFLARANGRIFVTGNTGRHSGDGGFNFLNLRRGSPIRSAIMAPPGYRIVHRDSSQIEARMVAWLARCKQLLTAFAEGRDVYSEFASRVYGRNVTKANVGDRHVGKVSILALGYGMGAERFLHTLFIGNGGVSLKIPLEEAQRIVWLYRREFSEIPALWADADLMLHRMVDIGRPMDGRREVRPERSHGQHDPKIPAVSWSMDAIWLPNKMAIQYPNLRVEFLTLPDGTAKAEIVYDGGHGRGRVKMFGGKCVENCLGGDTEVMTARGWVSLAQVSDDDLLWDGVEWVAHDGVLNKGRQNVIVFGGILITPDHNVYVRGVPVKAGDADYAAACEGFTWPTFQPPCRYTAHCANPRPPSMAMPLRLRDREAHPGLASREDVRSTGQPEQTGVYDILNAGPRHRFTVRGEDGRPVVVSNCSQALARIVITDVSLRVRHTTGHRPFLTTYDSLDYCVPEGDAEAVDAMLEHEFAVPPTWAPDLPLASEGGWGKTLMEAEKRTNA